MGIESPGKVPELIRLPVSTLANEVGAGRDNCPSQFASTLRALVVAGCIRLSNFFACAFSLCSRLGSIQSPWTGRRQIRTRSPGELVDALAFALRCNGRKRVRTVDEIMAVNVAKRAVEHL